MIYKIHHLHCGSLCPYCAPLFGQQGLKAEIVCHCLLVETDKGLVLIDTGLGIQDYLHPQKRLGSIISKFGTIQNNLNLTAIAQIQTLGFKPTDVKHILVTHLDFDHAGGSLIFLMLRFIYFLANSMQHKTWVIRTNIAIERNSSNSIDIGISSKLTLANHGLICLK